MRTLECIREGKISEVKLPGDWAETKIRVLLPARDGAMWIGSVRGLTRLQGAKSTKYTRAEGLGSDEVRALLEDRAGDLLIGTFGGGLSRLHEGHLTTLTTTNGLSSDNVWALYEDSEGALWIGADNGLNRLKDGRITGFTTARGLPDNQVNCILEDNFGRLWISYDHGIYWVHKQRLIDVISNGAALVDAVRY